MSATYYAILTNQGAARLANATALGTKLNLTQMGVGDANGKLPMPDPSQTALINQVRIAPLNQLAVDPVNASQIIAEQIIPEDVGGFWIREIGLYDSDGVLIAVANCPETYKPQLQEGSGRTQTIRMILTVSSTAAVTLKVDPSVVLATRQYVDNAVIEVRSYADRLMAEHLKPGNPHPQYALKDSPELTGTPRTPTPAAGDKSRQIANTEFVAEVVRVAIANLVASSPAALDTLNELAAALGNDPHFSTTIINALAGKQPLDNTLSSLSGKSIAQLIAHLGLSAFHSDPNFSSVSSPTAKVFFFVTDSGDWGVQDAHGTPLALPMDRGGSGANTQLGARINLLVQALTSGEDLTTLSSPTAKYFLYIDDTGAWGVQDSEGNARPLSVEGGGSGESTISATKLKLGLGAFNTIDEYSSVSSPDATVFFFIQDSGSWGVQDSGGTSIPLPIECGGTGERTLLGAKVKLGVDVVGKTDQLTTLSSPDASRFLFITNGTSWGLQTSNGVAIPLPMSSGGLGAVTPKGGRENLELGTAATKNVGNARDDVMTQGASIFWSALRAATVYDYMPLSAFLSTYQQTNLFPGTGQGTIVNVSMESNTDYGSRWIGDTAGKPYFQGKINGSLTDAYALCAIGKTVTADVNGFIKVSSPVVKLFSDGSCETNEESEGVTTKRVSTGVYKVIGSMGLNSDGIWTIEIPQDLNGNRLCFVDVKTSKGVVTVSVFKRRFDLDTAMVVAGDPMDIPEGRWLDLRLDMPSDSVYNLRMAEAEQAMQAVAKE